MEVKKLIPYRAKNSIAKYIINILIPILINGAVIGILVGCIVWGYNYCAEQILHFTTSIYAQVHAQIYFLPLLLLGVAALACLMCLLLKFIPELAGSGIPFTEGAMRGSTKYLKAKMFFGTIVFSFITFLAGLPLGSEGPSVQIGGIIGDSVSKAEGKIRWRFRAWNKLAITSGAAAGLAVAFNAPLTGIIFAFEEGHKKFSSRILLTTAATVIFALLTSRLLYYWTGIHDSLNFFMFDFGIIDVLPYTSIWLLLIIGAVIGLVASGFSLLMRFIRKFYEHFKIKRIYTLLFAFIAVGLVGVFFADVLGGGSSLIKKLNLVNEDGNFSLGWSAVLILLVLKIVLISVSSNSGTTGGLFIPMLVIGALVGALLGQVFINAGWMDTSHYTMIIVLAMASMMAAVVRAPITGIILVSEITGQLLNGFLQTAIVVVIAYFVVQIFNIVPLYDDLLENTLKKQNKDKKLCKLRIEKKIDEGAYVVGCTVRDIIWPVGCFIERVIKVNSEGKIVSRGDKSGDRVIMAGDIYIIRAETYNVEETLEELRALTSIEKRLDDDKVISTE